jgi:hypothetical protein
MVRVPLSQEWVGSLKNQTKTTDNGNKTKRKTTIRRKNFSVIIPTLHIFQKKMTDISLPRPEKKFSNLPSDWRLEQPPKGDWRFLGHPSHDARGHLKKHSQFSPWVLRHSRIHFLRRKKKKKKNIIVSVFCLVL